MYHLTPTIPILERHDWNAREPKPRHVTRQPAPPTKAFIHHGAETDRQAASLDTLGRIQDAMRAVQDFHMDTRGWGDIAYHYVVFQAHGLLRYPAICEGRLVHFIPAAQEGHNTGTFAVCVYGTVDKNDPALSSTLWALAHLLGGKKAGLTGAGHLRTVGGHRDVTQTDCPGNTLYGTLDRIAKLSHLERFHG